MTPFSVPDRKASVLPAWVPQSARIYVEHACDGRPLRAVAQDRGLSASTVLRQVRRVEARRDDPLIDDLMDLLGRDAAPAGSAAACRPAPLADGFDRPDTKESTAMSAMSPSAAMIDDEALNREARRVLRRLSEADAFLVVGQGMPQAVVLRDTGDVPTRIATLPRAVAQAMVMKDWIGCYQAGRVASYRITEQGRAALRRLLGEQLRDRIEARGMEESPSPFLTQHMELADRVIGTGPDAETLRVNLAESPLGSLARKKDRDGKPFLSMELVVAGERLRADFDRAQMGPRVGQNWDRFLTQEDCAGGGLTSGGPHGGSDAARARVSEALRALGPGLGDVVLRVCCFLEGLEAAERRMGWASRSGKIVLRIALQRLQMHYDRPAGR